MRASRPPTRSLDLFRSPAAARDVSGWRQQLERILRALGPTWQGTPLRRVIQTASLLIFLALFFLVAWPYAVPFSSRVLPDKEWLPVQGFLWLDPLVGLSTALAARAWNVALIGTGVVLLTGLILPRGFCGYLCPLGTLIDLWDAAVKHIVGLTTRLRGGQRPLHPRLPGALSRRTGEGRGEGLSEGEPIPPHANRLTRACTNLRFYLLAGVLTAALGGVLLSGFVAAIPLLTRGLLFSAGNVQLGLGKNWGMVPPVTGAVWLSLLLFAGVFLLGLLGPRFWCRHVCPTGALLSATGWFRRYRRQVDERCVACGKCRAACPFDAIQPDFGTRTLNCAFCQTCAGVCPTEAIHFVPLTTSVPIGRPEVGLGQGLTRRGMVGSLASGAVAAWLTRCGTTTHASPIRPPGAVSGDQFLDLCIRCEQCLKVCPGPVLQAAGLEHGFEALWTPVAMFPHAGCHQDCHFCTQVCPTGAIRPLSPDEKRRFVMGLAVVDPAACLPHRGELECRLCFEECTAAGYRAIEMRPVRLATGPVPEGLFSPGEIEQMGRILAPFVNAQACVGCGLCEYRCHAMWVRRQSRLARSAVVVRPP